MTRIAPRLRPGRADIAPQRSLPWVNADAFPVSPNRGDERMNKCGFEDILLDRAAVLPAERPSEPPVDDGFNPYGSGPVPIVRREEGKEESDR
jgi:hypothetical protein